MSCRIPTIVAVSLSAFVAVAPIRAQSGPYDPQVGSGAKDAIPRASSAFREWASSVASFSPGPQDIATPGSPPVNIGFENTNEALGPASTSGNKALSLGDGGQITLTFAEPIISSTTGGPDFAVFENGFTSGGAGLAYLELATVSVSSDGVHFFEFPAVSLTQTQTQVGGFGLLDASNLYDLAGKYIAGYGTPFDLSELAGASSLLNVNDVTEVRITDVVGSLNPLYGTRDSLGNLINDPFPTPFASSGFDLTGVGVINIASAVPEPSSVVSMLVGVGLLAVGWKRGADGRWTKSTSPINDRELR